MDYCTNCKKPMQHKNRGILFILLYPTSKFFMKKRCVKCNTKLLPKNVIQEWENSK